MRHTSVYLAVASVVTFVTAVSIAGSGAAARTATVNVQLGSIANEFALTPSVRSVPAGTVTFVVRNGGHLGHEFVVVKTATPAAKLPMSGGRASEKGSVGEIPEFGAGATKRLTLTLKPGHYALICNVSGHYRGGQHADFTVKATGV